MKTDSLHQYGSCTPDGACTVCGDTAVPVRVVAAGTHTARCEDRHGGLREVATDFVPGVRTGDVLLVHMGVAIARIQEGSP